MANNEEMLGGPSKARPAGAVGKWARWKEFEKPKRIVPVSLKNITGDEKSNPQFLDDDGKHRRLTFQDMDNEGMERMYDDPFPNFKDAVGIAMTSGVFAKGVPCVVYWKRDNKDYVVWVFEKDAR